MKAAAAPAALDQIAAEAAALDLESAPLAAPGADSLPAQSDAEEWAKLPAMFGSILCMAIPKLGPAYSPANCLAWGKAMDDVARAHGWNAAEIIRKFGPWPALVLASLPMALPTIAALKEARAGQAGAGTDTEAKPAEFVGPAPPPPGTLQPVTV